MCSCVHINDACVHVCIQCSTLVLSHLISMTGLGMSWLPQQACRASSYSATARDWRADRRDLAFAPASKVTWAQLQQQCLLNCVAQLCLLLQ